MKFMKKIVKFALAIAVATTTLFVGSINVKADGINYFYIENTSGSAVSVKFNNSDKLQYSFDKNDWADLPGSEGTFVTIAGSSKCYFKGKRSQGSLSGGNFIIDGGSVNVGGNVLSLLDPDPDGSTQMGEGAFFDLFMNCNTIVDASALELPDSVCQNCYKWMFLNCESLKKAPVLPAENMAVACYYGMFSGCKALETAPQLKSETLASSCYYKMFAGCTALKTAPELKSTNLANSCYYYMFEGCTALETAPVLPATILASSCYSGMFNGCALLTTAPELPAKTLAPDCYKSMFSSCTSLTEAPSILPAKTLTYRCYQTMFQGCSNLESMPVIKAENFFEDDYQCDNMFQGCSNLGSVVIIQQPKDEWVQEGSSATFSVVAQSTIGNNLKYKWFMNDGSGFVEIEGATASSYTISDAKKNQSDTKYYCKAIDRYNDSNFKDSSTVNLTVSSFAPPARKDASDDISKAPAYLNFIKENNAAEKKAEKKVSIDKDTYKSELPSKSVLAMNVADPNLFFDMKVHATEARNVLNQEFIAKSFLGENINIVLTKDIFSRRDLSLDENGEQRTLTWNNLKGVPAKVVYAVVYNETDGAYLMNGFSDGKGTATFAGFKMRPASTISIVTMK